MAKNVKKSNPFLTVVASILASVIGFVCGFYLYTNIDKTNVEKHSDHYVSGDLEIHHPELDSYYTGDCTIVKVGNVEVLIDAGASGATSVYEKNVNHMQSYIDTVCTDGILEYVVVTHAHRDHYACFTFTGESGSLFNRYQIGTIIDFAQTNQSSGAMYKNYLAERAEAVDAGATHLTAKQVVDSGDNVFELSNSVTMTILDQKYYHQKQSEGENDYSVCTLFSQNNTKHFLFTGDLEEKGEKSLVELNELPEVEVYKDGHHGSKTSSHNELLAEIKPKVVTVCCCAGTSEYTDTNANQFPTQEFINRVAVYTKQIYVTSLVLDDENKTYQSFNGNIVIVSSNSGVEVICSNNNTILKETDWFKNNRTWPSNGVM